MHNGCILCGGVGVGKTHTAIGYYLQNEAPRDVIVITTAKKRDKHDWQLTFADVGMTRDPDTTMGALVTVDSWNNIDKYKEIKDAFFIFDEQRLVGTGKWVKAFYVIAKNNHWVMLSATPGDNWFDYVPVFRANGFIKNITQFKDDHVNAIWTGTFWKIKSYRQVGKLVRWRNQLLVEMPYERHTTRHHHDIHVDYDETLVRRLVNKRWHVYEDRPLKDAAELYRVMRKVVYSDASRLQSIRTLLKTHPKLIVFYNYDYELEILRKGLTQLPDGSWTPLEDRTTSKSSSSSQTLSTTSSETSHPTTASTAISSSQGKTSLISQTKLSSSSKTLEDGLCDERTSSQLSGDHESTKRDQTNSSSIGFKESKAFSGKQTKHPTQETMSHSSGHVEDSANTSDSSFRCLGSSQETMGTTEENHPSSTTSTSSTTALPCSHRTDPLRTESSGTDSTGLMCPKETKTIETSPENTSTKLESLSSSTRLSSTSSGEQRSSVGRPSESRQNDSTRQNLCQMCQIPHDLPVCPNRDLTSSGIESTTSESSSLTETSGFPSPRIKSKPCSDPNPNATSTETSHSIRTEGSSDSTVENVERLSQKEVDECPKTNTSQPLSMSRLISSESVSDTSTIKSGTESPMDSMRKSSISTSSDAWRKSSDPSSTGRKSTSSQQFQVAEWNGHKHEEVPTSTSWIYLVQYVAGAEAWECTDTDSMVFYSMSPSYKNWHQAHGRIDRLNTSFLDLHYFRLISDALVEMLVAKSLGEKKSFNEGDYEKIAHLWEN